MNSPPSLKGGGEVPTQAMRVHHMTADIPFFTHCSFVFSLLLSCANVRKCTLGRVLKRRTTLVRVRACVCGCACGPQSHRLCFLNREKSHCSSPRGFCLLPLWLKTMAELLCTAYIHVYSTWELLRGRCIIAIVGRYLRDWSCVLILQPQECISKEAITWQKGVRSRAKILEKRKELHASDLIWKKS